MDNERSAFSSGSSEDEEDKVPKIYENRKQVKDFHRDPPDRLIIMKNERHEEQPWRKDQIRTIIRKSKRTYYIISNITI